MAASKASEAVPKAFMRLMLHQVSEATFNASIATSKVAEIASKACEAAVTSTVKVPQKLINLGCCSFT